MPRRRWIEPSFWEDPDVGQDLTPIERLFFIGCFSNADDEGRLYGNSAYLRKTIFGYDDITLEQVAEIRDKVVAVMSGSLCLYEVEGREYLAFPRWSDHQKPNYPKDSKLPPLPQGSRSRAEVEPKSDQVSADDMDRVGLDRVGLDGIGMDSNPSSSSLKNEFDSQWQAIIHAMWQFNSKSGVDEALGRSYISEVTMSSVNVKVPREDMHFAERLKPRLGEAIGIACPEWQGKEVVLEEQG